MTNLKAFIDIETGGFSIEKNGVCEIAMVITDSNFNVLSEFQSYIKPYMRPNSSEFVSYKADAMAVNGIKMSDLENGEYVSTVVQNFIFELRKYSETSSLTIIGHNSDAFDIPRLEYLIHRFYNLRAGSYINFALNQKEDTMKMVKEKLNLPSYSLENLCTHFGIENKKAHSALSDVYATIELYKKLTA